MGYIELHINGLPKEYFIKLSNIDEAKSFCVYSGWTHASYHDWNYIIVGEKYSDGWDCRETILDDYKSWDVFEYNIWRDIIEGRVIFQEKDVDCDYLIKVLKRYDIK